MKFNVNAIEKFIGVVRAAGAVLKTVKIGLLPVLVINIKFVCIPLLQSVATNILGQTFKLHWTVLPLSSKY